MQLTNEKIQEVTCGAVRFTQEEGGIRFWRFTEAQEELYKAYREELDCSFHTKTFTASNVRLVFKTDSAKLGMEILVSKGATRSFFDVEVLVNGKCIGTLNNHNDIPFPHGEPKTKYPLGAFQKEFDLGEGEKLVEVYLPWSVCTVLKSLTLDDGSFVTPVKRPKKMLIFGDSITQGYDVHSPSGHYTSRLAERLQADPVNKAIGGEVFFPPLAEAKDDFEPDYISVSYGSNDFKKTDGSRFDENCKAFYSALRKNYPNAKIFALTPIWRKDEDADVPFGAFSSVEERIRKAVADIPGIIVIRGYQFVPQNPDLFSDLRLHPDDNGFVCFGDNVLKAIEPYVAD